MHSNRSPNDRTSPKPKRRKTRKGTHSCWACKRRKEKCFFDHSAATCIGCQRRGTKCISQEYSDEDSTAPHDGPRQLGDRLVRVEALIEQLMEEKESQKSVQESDHHCGMPSSVSSTQGPQTTIAATQTSCASTPLYAPSEPGPISSFRFSTSIDHAPLSQTLFNALPSPSDTQKIIKASHHTFYMLEEILTIPYKTVCLTGLRSPSITLARPTPSAHPVLIARHMLRLAYVLQQARHNPRILIDVLSEPVLQLEQRLFDVSVRLVSTQDRLLSSIEALECVMLEGMYYANSGRIRLSWAAGRRSMLLAQLMGLNRPASRIGFQTLDPGSRADTRFMWFRIVHFDRYASLLLGLPQGTGDTSIVDAEVLEQVSEYEGLERRHCGIVAEILQRNESKHDQKADRELTRRLDAELQKAAKCVPAQWWLMPDLNNDNEKDDEKIYWKLKTIGTQMYHSHILIHLHLPYMLRSSSSTPPASIPYQQQLSEEKLYSKIVCVNAAREILRRFVVLQKSTRIAFSCCTTSFVALMAALTLLLVHLDSHKPSSTVSDSDNLLPHDSFLTHQYPSDRAMMEQVADAISEIRMRDKEEDTFSVRASGLLRRLLVIDELAASGNVGRARDVSVVAHGSEDEYSEEYEDLQGGEDAIVRFHIPYVGVVRIAREGTVTKEARRARIKHQNQSHALRDENQTFGDAIDLSFDSFLPNLMVGPEDWSFQGVDMAFFDSLIDSTDVEKL